MKEIISSTIKGWRLVIIHILILIPCTIFVWSREVNDLCTKIDCTTPNGFYLQFNAFIFIMLILSFIIFACIMFAASCYEEILSAKE